METLIIPAITIVSLVVSYWLITSARFRKDRGRELGAMVGAHSASMVDNAKFNQAKSKLDAIQELEDDGLTRAIVTQRISDFDEMFLGATPVGGKQS